MREQKISIRKLAKEIGLDPSFLSKVLTGKRSPPWDENILKKLAKILGMDPVYLILSTGRIPSQLQPTLEKPEVIQSLLNRSLPTPSQAALKKESPKKVSSSSPARKGKLVSLPPVSVPLSEDLL